VTDPIQVIVCEENPLHRTMVTDTLNEQADVTVTGSYSSGGQTLDALAAGQLADVILIDGQMQGLDGWDTTRLILQQRPDAAVVILSSTDSSEAVARAQDAGARGYPLKNVSPARLLEIVRALAAGELGFFGPA
jgi:two-component system, NarL family, nitrate/nitrite response regulator NarL